MEKEENKKNKTIIILSILLVVVSVGLISTLIGITIYKNTVYITFSKYYNISGQVSFYTYYEVEMSCNENKIVNVNDFTFQYNNEYRCASKISYNNKEYSTDENFVISKNTKNKLTIYFMIPDENNPEIIYYKLNKIKLYDTIKTQQKN